MNKTLSNAIMQRSKLRNPLLKNKTEENRNNYAKQRNLTVALLRKSKREFYGYLNKRKICDNKKFLGVLKPVLSSKVVSNEKITLVEQDSIVENNEKNRSCSQRFFL